MFFNPICADWYSLTTCYNLSHPTQAKSSSKEEKYFYNLTIYLIKDLISLQNLIYLVYKMIIVILKDKLCRINYNRLSFIAITHFFLLPITAIDPISHCCWHILTLTIENLYSYKLCICIINSVSMAKLAFMQNFKYL